ncbi:MAG: efflux RND transporter periplasmic adaptor subunit [Deltaproteobacteria bacterium]|nr:efflux RND transporter periplasmic adaptor subunit [Deltaproteobacteria bacterium]
MKRAILFLMVAACSKGGDGGGGGRGSGRQKLEYPVEVAPLEAKKMQYTVNAPGTLEAFQQVQITARVSGAVDKVTFSEGQNVKVGDTLAVIESERYAIAVEQARHQVAKAEATKKAAEAALQRRLDAQAASPGLVPGEEIETKRTQVDTAKADLDLARQALRVANLNLRDSSVRAPIEGVVQTRTVQQGQFLQTGAVLATILQREPLLLRFQVSEADAPRLRPDMPASLRIKESTREYTAKITLVAGAADPATRMVPVTAQLDPTEHQYRLRPGAFCEVTVPIGDARQGIVVPSLAVAPTEQGNVVFVVDEKTSTVKAKVVQVGMHTSEGGVELRQGVSAGDLMVMRGIEPLSDGAPVKIANRLTLEQALIPAKVADETSRVGPGAGSGAAGSAEGAAPAEGSGSGRRRRRSEP